MKTRWKVLSLFWDYFRIPLLALILFVWTTCFGRSCRLQMLFCTDIDLTEQALSSLDRDVYKIFVIRIWRIHPSFSTAVWNISSRKWTFSMGKRKTSFQRVVFQISRPFVFWLFCCGSILKPVFKGYLKQFICFWGSNLCRITWFNRNCFAQMTNERQSNFWRLFHCCSTFLLTFDANQGVTLITVRDGVNERYVVHWWFYSNWGDSMRAPTIPADCKLQVKCCANVENSLWKICSQITMTQQIQVTVRHLSNFVQPVNNTFLLPQSFMTECVLLFMSGFQKDCQTIFLRLKEFYIQSFSISFLLEDIV